MEKRFVNFLLISLAILLAYPLIMARLFPQPQVAEQDDPPVAEALDGAVPPQAADDATPAADASDPKRVEGDQAAREDAPAGDEADDGQMELAAADLPERHISVGSLDPDSPHRMAVTFSTRGAAIERIELNDPRYTVLDDRSGYFGSLQLTDDAEGGCRVNVVAAGTPASLAKPTVPNTDIGLRGPTYDESSGELQLAGDRIVMFDGEPVVDSTDLNLKLAGTRYGDQATLTVERTEAEGASRQLDFTVVLTRRPLAVVQPEWEQRHDVDRDHPASFLWTLDRIGDRSAGMDVDEIPSLPSLRKGHWRPRKLPADGDAMGPGVEFRRRLTPEELAIIGVSGDLEVIKRYRLAVMDPVSSPADAAANHLTFEIEIINRGTTPIQVGYRLDGPTGLPLEGWWYSYKVLPRSFGGAGARDVVWRTEGRNHELFGCPAITKQVKKFEDGKADSKDIPLFDASNAQPMQYAGTDSQYFCVVMQPYNKGTDSGALPSDDFVFEEGIARAIGPLDEKSRKRTDVAFRLTSREVNLAPGDRHRQEFRIFAGPKEEKLLKKYGLEDCIVYGWFGKVSRPMIQLLHLFYWIVGGASYGLAIIILTVLVRGCLYPFGRKMALNAQKMQQLAPEMKKITEKYKNDMEKRAAAQQELFKKNNYNPLSGCLVMFIQFPIFLGLYRGLSVDIALRQAPLIPGMRWCSNLAGPDKFWNWQGICPDFLASETGMLGPYLNILPLVTCGLFIMHQKLFTPPPTDEQQEMQQRIMKFMMLFMGVMFHKVAAGLCIYFIASSLWGLAERLLLPKPKLAGVTGFDGGGSTDDSSRGGGGSPPSGGKPDGGPGGVLGKLMKMAQSNGQETTAEKVQRRRKQQQRGRKQHKKK